MQDRRKRGPELGLEARLIQEAGSGARTLLSGERSRLARASAALPFRPGGNAGISLLLRQQGAAMTRGGAEPGPLLELGRCAQILGSGPAAAVLIVAR